MNKKNIITLILSLFTLMGQAQMKCHIEGELCSFSQLT